MLKRAYFYSPLSSCADFTAALTAVSWRLPGELSGICGRCFTRGVTKRGAPSPVCCDRAERFTPRLSEGNICVLANGHRPLGRRGNRLPAAVGGGGLCHSPGAERDEDEGGGGGGEAAIPVSNPAAGTQRRSPVLKGLPNSLRLSVSIRDAPDYTLAVSGPRVPLSADTEIESYMFKMITALDTKRFIGASRAA